MCEREKPRICHFFYLDFDPQKDIFLIAVCGSVSVHSFSLIFFQDCHDIFKPRPGPHTQIFLCKMKPSVVIDVPWWQLETNIKKNSASRLFKDTSYFENANV